MTIKKGLAMTGKEYSEQPLQSKSLHYDNQPLPVGGAGYIRLITLLQLENRQE